MKDMSEEKDGLFEKGQLLVQLTEKIKDLESRLKEAEKESYECTCTTNPYESLCRFCYVQNALKICKDNIELKQRLSQAEAENQWRKEAMDNHDSRLTVHLLRNWDKEKRDRFCVHILGDDVESLKARLSQAEAENRDLRLHPCIVLESAVVEKNVLALQSRVTELEGVLKEWDLQGGSKLEKIKSLEERLSHLMDVAGKLDSALEWMNDYAWDLSKRVKMNALHTVPVFKNAKDCRAEWDGIKK